MASSVSKQLLNEFKHPLTLSMGQFFVGTALCLVRAAAAPPKSEYGPKCQPLVLSFRGLWTIATQYRFLGLQLGAGVILTSVCHRFALMSMPVSFVHTVKSMQPLYAAIMSRLVLGTPCPIERTATICLVIAGVALSAYSELDYTWSGLIFAQLSVLAIASSSVLQKRYMRSSTLIRHEKSTQRNNNDKDTEEADIVTRDKQIFQTLPSNEDLRNDALLPGPSKLASYASTPELAAAVNVATDPLGARASASLAKNSITPAASLDTNSVFFITNAFALLLLFPVWCLFDPTAISELRQGGLKLIATLGLTSLAVVAQHFASISVLEAASTPITHAVASTFKRIFVIITAIIWFEQNIAPLNAIGIFISVCGVALYDRTGRRAPVVTFASPSPTLSTSERLPPSGSKQHHSQFGWTRKKHHSSPNTSQKPLIPTSPGEGQQSIGPDAV